MALTCNAGYNKIKQFNATTTKEDVINAYAEWGPSYDNILRDIAYIGPSVGAKLLDQKLKEFSYKNDVEIFDLGCGTGLVGEQLYKRGYKNIDGMDLSEHMLQVCKDKGVYRSLHKGSMGSENSSDLGVPADKYDAVICVGVFTAGHVKGKGLDDFIYSVKKGGLIVFNINDNVSNDPHYEFDKKMNELTKDRKWEQLFKYYEPKYVSDRGANFYVYRKL